MLVRQEQHLAAMAERPGQGPAGVGGGADRAAVPAGEGLDVGRGVHVGDRDDLAGDAEVLQCLPALLDLVVGGHVGHGAAGRKIRQHHLLAVRGQDVGGLGHEVHAAEHDELSAGPRCCVTGQFERVASDVGELDDLVPLVVVAEHEGTVTERLAGRAGAADRAEDHWPAATRRDSRHRARESGSAPAPSTSSGRLRRAAVASARPVWLGDMVIAPRSLGLIV